MPDIGVGDFVESLTTLNGFSLGQIFMVEGCVPARQDKACGVCRKPTDGLLLKDKPLPPDASSWCVNHFRPIHRRSQHESVFQAMLVTAKGKTKEKA